MRISVEKRWAKMEQKLFIVAFALHPARHMQHFDTERQEFVHGVHIASYATELYQRFFQPADNAQLDQIFQQMASYIAKTDSFSASLPRYTDTSLDPITFWKLMSSSAPQLAKLAIHLFQIAVNSAAVERLFSTFGNMQTKRRNAFVHERLRSLPKSGACRHPKPKKEKDKPAGNQYLGLRSVAQQAAAAAEAAVVEAAQATQDMADQFVDGVEDLLVSEHQVADVFDELTEQVDEDAADDVMYHASHDRISLGNMFLFSTSPTLIWKYCLRTISLHPTSQAN